MHRGYLDWNEIVFEKNWVSQNKVCYVNMGTGWYIGEE